MGLRGIIHICAPGGQLTECINRALTKAYQGKGGIAPEKLEEMGFEDYRSIIICGQNWPLFEIVLGHNRDLISAKLERLRVIRNDVFHFRSDINQCIGLPDSS